ncbi:hypothetical protein K435DRAFT_792978 [Dendrothele bispora CBS 962.96]|uniref:DUF6535 domain-containing protein n=1 Tax=Dendrothele bispora (strain CBS 962.96) TaxID=1314807 RepID=A0A4S8MGX8_DENBC|nr:hypothetical protein K435DRAFT_792978 [Dendrothele bispora CBS 962.96]
MATQDNTVDSKSETSKTSDADRDACSKLWAVYVGEAEKYDGGLVAGWKDDMSDLVVFSALYSAVLTAFIIESYQKLQQDPADITVALLIHISRQLANGTTPAFEGMNPFQPDTSSVICNILWFIALALALTCSLLAILVQQWTRDFKHKTTLRPSPVLRAKIFMFTYSGVRRFGMHTIVDVTPLLLHISLILFFAGLVEFLVPVNKTVRTLIILFLVVFGVVYVVLTFLPIIYLDAPFHTPLSSIIWIIGNTARRWLQHIHGLRADIDFSLTESSLEKSYHEESREQQALEFTLKSLSNDSELLPLIEAIPDVIHDSGILRSSVTLIAPFFSSSTPETNIISHIAAFSDNPSAWLDEKIESRCLTAYPRAIWAVAYMMANSSLTPRQWVQEVGSPVMDVTRIWFPRSIVNRLRVIADKSQDHSVQSASALLRLCQLCSLQCRASVMEIRLQQLLAGSLSQRRNALEVALELCQNVDTIENEITYYGGILPDFVVLQKNLRNHVINSHQSVVHIGIPPTFGFRSREWINAQIRILSQFLVESFYTEPNKLYMFYKTHKSLWDRIILQLSTIKLSVHTDGLEAHLLRPLSMFANLTFKGSFLDTLFIHSINLFSLDKAWALGAGLHKSVVLQSGVETVCQDIIINYVMKKVSSLQFLHKADTSGFLEAFTLGQYRVPSGWGVPPEKYLPLTWLLFSCLSQGPASTDHSHHGHFALQISQRWHPDLFQVIPMGPLVHTYTHLVLCSLLSIELLHSLESQHPVTSSIEDKDGLLQCVKSIGAELLPGITKFKTFSFSKTSTENSQILGQIHNFHTYVTSLQFILISRLIDVYETSVQEVEPFCYRAFREQYLRMLPNASPGDIYPTSQITFAHSVSNLIARCQRLTSADEPLGHTHWDETRLQQDILQCLLVFPFGCNWMTVSEAAQMFQDTLNQNAEFLKHFTKEHNVAWGLTTLHHQCNMVLGKNQEEINTDL